MAGEKRTMKATKIAVVQMNARVNMKERNLAAITGFVNQAKEGKVDIICFPELSITSYNRELANKTAENLPGRSSLALSRLACQSGVTILAGLAEKNGYGKPLITHLVAYPDGSMQKYQKTHLGVSEKDFFAAGNCLPVFPSEKIVFGIQLCWELHFPEISTVLALNGCELIFAPHASPIGGKERMDIWLKYLTARAYDNSVYLAACNLVGFDGVKQEFGGGSIIINPKGEVVSQQFNKEEGLITAELDHSLVNEIRTERHKSMKNSFFLSARRPELYGELTKGVKF
jgi:predicted amidohydrolase